MWVLHELAAAVAAARVALECGLTKRRSLFEFELDFRASNRLANACGIAVRARRQAWVEPMRARLNLARPASESL